VSRIKVCRLEHGERNRDRQLADGFEHVDLGGEDDERVNRLAEQEVEARPNRIPVLGRDVGDADAVAGLARRNLDSLDARGRPVQRALDREHPDRVRTTGDERTRGRVRSIAEFVDDPQDLFAGARTDGRTVVQDPRHGLVRDTRVPRNIADVGGANPLTVHPRIPPFIRIRRGGNPGRDDNYARARHSRPCRLALGARDGVIMGPKC
jgi:hypothetical protein